MALTALLGGMSVAAAAADQAAVQKRLESEYALTKTTDDKIDIVTAGAVLVLQKDKLMMLVATAAAKDSRPSFPCNTYKDGKLSQYGACKPATVPWHSPYHAPRSRYFVTGEKFWVTGIEVKDAGRDSAVVMQFFSDAINDVRYSGALSIPFKEGLLSPDDVLKRVQEVVKVAPSDDADQGGGQQQASAPAAPPLIAPPPPPPPDAGPPPTVSLGQTPDQVVGILGEPLRKARVGVKEIYFYKDLKVTFVNGKVTDGAAAQVNTSPEQTGVNLLFVYKLGHNAPDHWCGQDGCALDVYVDDGTGYKKALGWLYAGSTIRISRGNGQVALFIPLEHHVAYGGAEHLAPATDDNGPQREWVLEGDSFKQKRRPFPPDCCGQRAIESAAKTYPQQVAEFNAAQQRDLHGAKIIVFSQDRGTADVTRTYPFLRGSLYGINAVRIAESRGH